MLGGAVERDDQVRIATERPKTRGFTAELLCAAWPENAKTSCARYSDGKLRPAPTAKREGWLKRVKAIALARRQ